MLRLNCLSSIFVSRCFGGYVQEMTLVKFDFKYILIYITIYDVYNVKLSICSTIPIETISKIMMCVHNISMKKLRGHVCRLYYR